MILPIGGTWIPNNKYHNGLLNLPQDCFAFQTYGNMVDSRGCITTTKRNQENNLGSIWSFDYFEQDIDLSEKTQNQATNNCY